MPNRIFENIKMFLIETSKWKIYYKFFIKGHKHTFSLLNAFWFNYKSIKIYIFQEWSK